MLMQPSPIADTSNAPSFLRSIMMPPKNEKAEGRGKARMCDYRDGRPSDRGTHFGPESTPQASQRPSCTVIAKTSTAEA
jgi:hypothetical protein